MIRIEAESEVVTVDAMTLQPYTFDAEERLQDREDLLHNLEVKLSMKHGQLSKDLPAAELDEMVGKGGKAVGRRRSIGGTLRPTSVAVSHERTRAGRRSPAIGPVTAGSNNACRRASQRNTTDGKPADRPRMKTFSGFSPAMAAADHSHRRKSTPKECNLPAVEEEPSPMGLSGRDDPVVGPIFGEKDVNVPQRRDRKPRKSFEDPSSEWEDSPVSKTPSLNRQGYPDDIEGGHVSDPDIQPARNSDPSEHAYYSSDSDVTLSRERHSDPDLSYRIPTEVDMAYQVSSDIDTGGEVSPVDLRSRRPNRRATIQAGETFGSSSGQPYGAGTGSGAQLVYSNAAVGSSKNNLVRNSNAMGASRYIPDQALSQFSNGPYGPPCENEAFDDFARSRTQRSLDAGVMPAQAQPRRINDVGRAMSQSEIRAGQYRRLNWRIRYLENTSKRSSLIILNLPDPNEEESAVDYMQYVQILTQGCDRCMLVHGTGLEVISGFNAVVEDLEVEPDDAEQDPVDVEQDQDAPPLVEEIQVEVKADHRAVI